MSFAAPGSRDHDRGLVLSALAAVFHRYSGQNHLGIEVFTAERRAGAAFVEIEIDPAEPFSTLMARLGRALVTPSHTSARPRDEALSNVAVTFASAADDGPRDDRERDLHVRVAEDGGRLVLRAVVYNARLFRPETIARLSASFAVLCEAARADPGAPVGRLPILDDEDLLKLRAFGDTGHEAHGRAPVHELFQAHARAQPDAPAALFRDRRLTYGALDARANALAHHLVARGVGPGVPVAVCVEPSLDVLVALLATFKAGGIYLPLDPTYPPALIAAVLDEARPRLVITQSRLSAVTAAAPAPQLFLDAPGAALEGHPLGAPAIDTAGDPLDRPCYQLYTSGTTGKPKGVIATHRNLAHYVDVARKRYGFRSSDVFCSLARYTFSISMFELVSPLCCGGAVRLLPRDEVLSPEHLSRALQTVTVVHAGPSLLGNLFRHLRADVTMPRTFPNMRHASSGGDIVPPSIMEEMKTVFENAELFVIYGCTEISCMGCTYPIERDRKIPTTYVGKPFPGVTVRLVDPSREALVPIGVVGEICFSGPGVVAGYFNRPAQTAEKFIELEGRRFYATGDMGRWSADGELEILGRRDHQVQLRGIRVELAGIENTVRELGLATQCVTILKKLDDQDVRLVAFLVEPREPDVVAFRRALGRHLPDYMLPQSMVVLDALPLTANGKVDRRKLQEMPLDLRAAATPGNGPRDAVESKIAGSFARVLNVPEVGIDDDFFDLGGHSLLAVALLDDLQDALGFAFPPHVVFEGATVRRLAELSRASFSTVPRPIPLNTEGAPATLYALMGIHLYRELARLLDGRVSVYGVYAARELVMFESPDQAPSVIELARTYVEIIQQHQPSGPYHLLGMSFGGVVAFEVAQQLRAAGHEVAFLGLLDAILPTRGLRARLRQLHYLASRPRGELLPQVVRRLNAWLRPWFLGGLPYPTEFQRFADVAELAPMENQRQDAYRLATGDYMDGLRSFTGDAVLYVAERLRQRHLMQLPSLGWRELIPDLRVQPVDAEHLGLLEQPGVREIADSILESFQARPAGSNDFFKAMEGGGAPESRREN